MSEQWPVKQLAEICKIFSDGDWIESKDQSPSGIRLVQTGNIGEGVFKDRKDKARYISESTFSRLNCTEIFEGDCLISRLPRPVGRACIIPNTGERMITAVDCSILRFKQDMILPQFFVYYSQSAHYSNQIQPLCTGSTRKRISRKNLGKITIPVPPLSEQERIVMILEETLSKIENNSKQLQTKITGANELFSSILHSEFASNVDTWFESELSEIAYTAGRIGWKGLTAKEYTDSGPLFLSVHSLNYGHYVDFRDANHISQQRYDESPEIMLEPNDILICKDGAGIGKLGIVNQILSPSTINGSLLLIRASEKLVPKFLYYCLLSPYFQSIVQTRLEGSTTPHLYQRDIKQFPVRFPTIPLQKEIVEKLDYIASDYENLLNNYSDEIKILDELKLSMLKEGFDGKLTGGITA